MTRFIKIFGWTIFIIAFLAIAAILVALRLFDPNDFKPTIVQLARENAAVDLHIPGDLSWQLWPYLGISMGRTEVRIADQEPLFAAIDSATTSVAVLPLFKGQVQLSGINVTGLELNLEETAEGANWDPIVEALAGEGDAADAPVETESSSFDIPVTIPKVTVENGRLRYRNQVDGSDIIVDQVFVTATDVDLKKSFPLELSLRYQDQADMRVELNASSNIQLDMAQEIYRLEALKAAINLAGITVMPVNIDLSADITANLKDDAVTVDNLVVDAAGVRATGNVGIEQLSSDMIFTGALQTSSFNANSLLKNIGELPIETTDPKALSDISLKATLNGPANSLMLNPLAIKLDSSNISGKAGITNLTSGAINFDLALDHIRVDGYLPPSTEAPQLNPGTAESVDLLPAFSSEPLLPLEDLRSFILNGNLKIGKVEFETLEASDLTIALSARDGLLSLDSFKGSTLGGSLQGKGSLDARTSTPKIQFNGDFKQLQLQPLVKWALDKDLFIGLSDIRVDFTASGNSEKALAESGKGKVDFTLRDGTVRGLNLYNTLLGGVNDMLGAYSVLASFIPGQESGKLPLELSEDTKIVDLSGTATISNLVASIDNLRAELNRGTLTGNGKLNLATQAFDMRLGIKSPEITSNKYLKDTTWPLRCHGNLNGSPVKWCGHDNQAFRDIGKKVAADVTRDQLKDRLGITAEGDTAQEILKNAAQEKAQEAVQKEVQKATDSLRDRLARELQKRNEKSAPAQPAPETTPAPPVQNAAPESESVPAGAE